MTIFIDSNIPMYLVGAGHPNKDVARRLLEEAIGAGDRLVTDAEVLQEILHRYVAIGRRDAIGPAVDAVLGVVDEVFPIELVDVQRAQRILATVLGISARDAIHVAVIERREVERVMSFDRGLDQVPGLVRIGE